MNETTEQKSPLFRPNTNKKPTDLSAKVTTSITKEPAKPAKPATKKEANSRILRPNINTTIIKSGKPKKQFKANPNEKKLKIIPLGGLNEIGKNITVFEYEDEAIIVDCGLAFPDDDMLGIDLVIPDTSYLEKIKDKVHAIVLTHGHEDHIGAIPFVLREYNFPIYGTRLTLGILHNKLKEAKLDKTSKLIEVAVGSNITLGNFNIEFIRVNHSIADACALAITTPAGIVLHTGDFKIDSSPIQGEMIDLARIGELSKKGILLLMSDSTNVERAGYTVSERKVGESFDSIFQSSVGRRLIIATFASNVHRVQLIIDSAVKHGRKVAISGRSMVNIVSVATSLGYMHAPEGTLIDIDTISRYPQDQIVLVTTGTQGEPMSALYRMAFSDHKKVELGVNDLVVMSSSAIPGNEKEISKVINELFKVGAEVIYESYAEVHVSGHACQDELKLMMALAKPKYFIPVHGEFRHLKKHAGLAKYMGIPTTNIFILDIGDVFEISESSARITGSVPAGKVLVDGLGVGDVGNIVLRDRKHLAEDGLIVLVATLDSQNGALISGPDIVSRGFVYVRESEQLIDTLKSISRETILNCEAKNIKDWGSIKSMVKDALSDYLYKNTKRKPMILVVLTEV
ncbi:MAG: ribonuclease J, partial [Clostridia bacterium]